MFLLSHVKNEKAHYWAVWGTKRHLQEPTRRLARTVGSSTGLERWCLHMRRQLQQQCHRCCCIHIHVLLSPPPHGWSLLREFGALDALTMSNSCWGCSPSCIPTEHQKPMRRRFDLAPGLVALLVSEKTSSVDTYLEAGLDASLFMVASWPEWMGTDMSWGILPIDCREDGTLRQTVSSANAPAREAARMSMWLALTVQVWSRQHWEM